MTIPKALTRAHVQVMALADKPALDDGDMDLLRAACRDFHTYDPAARPKDENATDTAPVARQRHAKTVLPRESQRTRREGQARKQVRLARLELNPRCEARDRGLPGGCGGTDGQRPQYEVHEIVERSVAPGSHLVLGLTATLCQWHHDAVTDATGRALEQATVAGLVLPSHAVTYDKDNAMNRRLPRLRPEYQWARP